MTDSPAGYRNITGALALMLGTIMFCGVGAGGLTDATGDPPSPSTGPTFPNPQPPNPQPPPSPAPQTPPPYPAPQPPSPPAPPP